jgi:anti-sigma factor RsiW
VGTLIRMSDCREIELLVAPYVDCVASSHEQEIVEQHLRRCPQCERRVAAERAVRAVIKRQACHLTAGRAPTALCARMARLSCEPQSPWRLWQVGVAAVLALACSVLLVMTLTRLSTPVLAAQLVADHAKCFHNTAMTTDVDAIRAGRELTAKCGFTVRVPDDDPDLGLRLVGARRCLSGEGINAHLLYAWHGRAVSLFMLPDARRDQEALRLFGHDARVWSGHNRTYVLVSEASDRSLAPLVAHMRRATE